MRIKEGDFPIREKHIEASEGERRWALFLDYCYSVLAHECMVRSNTQLAARAKMYGD